MLRVIVDQTHFPDGEVPLKIPKHQVNTLNFAVVKDHYAFGAFCAFHYTMHDVLLYQASHLQRFTTAGR